MPNSAYEGALLPFRLGFTLLKTIAAGLTAPLYNISPTYLTHISNAGLRSLLGTLSPTQLQMLMPSFLDTYRSYCSNKYIDEPQIVPIENTTTSGFWLGNPRKAKQFMLYLHGGGYVTPASSGHIAMLDKFISWSGNKLAVFCVAYTLSPEAVYPLALSQCVEGLRYVLTLPQVTPTNLILAGDSAGGALVLALLSHISSHPHPNTEVVKALTLEDGQKVKAAILIGPFISNANTPSMKRFATRDTFDKPTADAWLRTYHGGKPGFETDPYILPAVAEAGWWTGTRCKQVFVTVGEEELLRDAVFEWVDKYREGIAGGKKGSKGRDEEPARLAVGEKETHIYPVLSPYEEERLEELGEKSQEGALRTYIKEIAGL